MPTETQDNLMTQASYSAENTMNPNHKENHFVNGHFGTILPFKYCFWVIITLSLWSYHLQPSTA